MSWNTPKIKRWYSHWLLWTILLVAASAFFGWPKLKSRYQRWNSDRKVAKAEQAIAEGDFRHAVLLARMALNDNPMSPAAVRVMAKAAEGAGMSAIAARWRSQFDSIQPGDRENIMAWASDSLKAGDVTAAERILAMLKPEPTDDADYHATAAAVATARGDAAAAERHWTEAVRVAPKDDGFRIRLASLRLNSKNAVSHDEAVGVLREISRRPQKSLEALRALLSDAMNYKDWGKAFEYLDAIVADPGVTFADKLARLSALREMRATEATDYLLQLRDGAISNSTDLYLLFMWMNQHDLALMVSDWARTLPADVISGPPACVAVADAYCRTSEWKRLNEYVDERAWGDSDYLRRAFRSRALEKLDETGESAQEWKDGLSAARSRGDSRACLERMVRLAIGWNWTQQAQEVMWRMATAPNCPRWMLDALYAIAFENRNASQLQTLAGILAQVDSKSVVLRNDSAFHSLLVRSDKGNPHGEAEKLFAENPGDSSVALTRALSLFQQGEAAAAAALTGSLPADELKKPRTALYHAIFLTAAGKGANAAEFLVSAQGWEMYPEEKTLLDRAKTLAGKTAGDSEIAASAKALRAAKAARDLEAEKAVVAARAERMAKAAQAAQDAQDAAQSPAPAKSGGLVPPR